MTEDETYSPPSDFLIGLINDEVTLGDHAFGRANLARLVAMTRDPHAANRDWATHLLANTPFDDAVVRAALRARLEDEGEETRFEALIGVAMREPDVALPMVRALLEGEVVASLVLEAAAYVADPALVPVLDGIAASWAEDDERDAQMDWFLSTARAACAAGVQPEWRDVDD